MISDNERAEQLVKKLREKRAFQQRNSFEIGDYVITCTGHTGVIQSYSMVGDRYYQVRILDEGSMSEEHLDSGGYVSRQSSTYVEITRSTHRPRCPRALASGA